MDVAYCSLIVTTLQSHASVFFTTLLPRQGQVYVEQAPPSYWSVPVNPASHWSTSPGQLAGQVSTIERHQLTKSCGSGGSLCCQCFETSLKPASLAGRTESKGGLWIKGSVSLLRSGEAAAILASKCREWGRRKWWGGERGNKHHGFGHPQDKKPQCSSGGPGG